MAPRRAVAFKRPLSSLSGEGEMLAWFPGLSRATRFHMCLPASLSPAEAPSWLSCGCRFRPVDTKAGKVLTPFILVRDGRRAFSFLWGMGCGCALSFPKSMAALSKHLVLPTSRASGLQILGWRAEVLQQAVLGGAPLYAPLVPPAAVPPFLHRLGWLGVQGTANWCTR